MANQTGSGLTPFLAHRFTVVGKVDKVTRRRRAPSVMEALGLEPDPAMIDAGSAARPPDTPSTMNVRE